MPTSTFYFFFYDYHIDFYNTYNLSHAELTDHFFFITSYYFNFEYLMGLAKNYFSGFFFSDILPNLIPNFKEDPSYFLKALFCHCIGYIASVNDLASGDLFMFFCLTSEL